MYRKTQKVRAISIPKQTQMLVRSEPGTSVEKKSDDFPSTTSVELCAKTAQAKDRDTYSQSKTLAKSKLDQTSFQLTRPERSSTASDLDKKTEKKHSLPPAYGIDIKRMRQERTPSYTSPIPSAAHKAEANSSDPCRSGRRGK